MIFLNSLCGFPKPKPKLLNWQYSTLFGEIVQYVHDTKTTPKKKRESEIKGGEEWSTQKQALFITEAR